MLSEEERHGIVASPDFVDFVSHSSKIIERALNEPYDIMRDYTAAADIDPYAPNN